MNLVFIFFVLSAFLAVVMLVEGLYNLWNASRGPEAKRISKRLQTMSASGYAGTPLLAKSRRKLSDNPALESLLLAIPRIHRIDRLLEQSGYNISVAQFLGLCLAIAFVVLVVGLILGLPAFLVVLLVLGGVAAPYLLILNQKLRRLATVERQLPDTLDLISRALRAGHSFPSAMEMVSQEGLKPIAEEFHIVSDEINFGIPMEDALNNLATRVPSTDLRYFVVAVLIQRDTGGNLAELLDNLAKLMRERFKLLGQIQVLTAEGRLSAWILTLLPLVLAVLINLINPRLMSVLYTDPFGQKMIAGALIGMVLGIFWMWRIIKIRV